MADCDDIAIVGAGCRFPGANDLEEFWRVLVNGENHVKKIPRDRWNNEVYYDKDTGAPGKIYIQQAGLLDGHDEFDPAPFGISVAEAERMDPQQRYVLECVHMALEDGGITRASLSGTQTGVYIGFMNDDYKSLFHSNHAEDNTYSACGFSTSIIANRVSYVYNLFGPSITIDTACSSSLVAVHLARQAILTAVHLARQAIFAGECDMAICGGVNSIISPDTFIPLCRAQMMSAVGQCQAFCDTADGYVRGEGCGIVILKKLTQAVKDGNKIWATVKTVVNQDGHAVQPLTSPSPEQQFKLLEKCYSNLTDDPDSVSSVDASSVQYIEAHGTGTRAGDPVETNTLGRFFSQHREIPKINIGQLHIGSVKTNIGHTESAAGIAGLIKTLLMMKHGYIVPTLHIKKDLSNLHPGLQLAENGIQIANQVQEWKSNRFNNRIACVNSFGLGGTNCHCVLFQKYSFTNISDAAKNGPVLVALSAANKESLEAILTKFRLNLWRTKDSLRNISYTSTCLRDHYNFRLCFAVNSVNELIEKADETSITDRRPHSKRNIVFVYGGTGTTWTGMCSELIVKDASFREGVINVDKYLEPLAGISMVAMFEDPTSEYNDPFLIHIAVFSTQVGLTEMWRNNGVHPDSVIGLSVGEVAAAYASGRLDLKSAVQVIYYRSKYLSQCSGGTMMVVANLEVSEVEQLCDKYERKVTVAVYLSPVACTLSGESEIMNKIKVEIQNIQQERNIIVFQKDMSFNCAYHCNKVVSCLHDLKHSIKALKSKDRHWPMFSSVTGKLTNDELLTADYWVSNVREPVLAKKAILASAQDDMKNIFIEIGPHPFVKPHIADIFKGRNVSAACLPSIMKRKEMSCIQSTIAVLFTDGVNIEWKHESQRAHVSEIPRYVFTRRKMLFIPENMKKQYQEGLSSLRADDHLFVKCCTKEGVAFEIRVGKEKTPFIFDHYLSGKVLVPGATYIEAALIISRKTFDIPVQDISVSLEFLNTLAMNDRMETCVDCKVSKSSEVVTIAFVGDNRILCTAKCAKKQAIFRKPVSLNTLQETCSESLSKSDVYACLEKFGYQYGPSLSLIERAWCTDTECLAEIVVPPAVVGEFSNTQVHPAVLDSMLQLPGVLKKAHVNGVQVFPKRVRSVTVTSQPIQRMFCYGVITRTSHSLTHINLLLLDTNGIAVCEICDFTLKEVDMLHDVDKYAYNLDWHILKEVSESKAPHHSNKLAVWCTPTARTVIEPVLKYSNAEYHSLDYNCRIEAHELETVIRNTDQDLYQALIFAPFFDSSECDEVYHFAKQTLLCLKHILTALHEGLINAPLFIVTKNTQVCGEVSNTVSSLSGSELWGFVRSVIKEAVYPEIRLLDIDPANCDEERFVQILNNSFPNVTELRLDGSCVYTNSLVAHNSFLRNTMQKYVHLQDTEAAGVKSSLPGNLYNPYLRGIETKEPEKSSMNDFVKLRLTSACLHHEAFYPATIDTGDAKYSVWPELAKDGFQALCLEGQGHAEAEPDKHGCLSNNSLKYFCYPSPIATHLKIPREYVFEQSDIPSYSPGLLTASVVLYQLSTKIPASSNVCVFFEDKSDYFLRLLQIFFANSKSFYLQNTDVVSKNLSLTDNHLKDVKYLILLCKLDRQSGQYLLNILPNVKKIVSMSKFLPKAIRRWLVSQYNQVEISSTKAYKLFQARHLAKILKHVHSALALHSASLYENDSRENETRVPKRATKEIETKENPLSLPRAQVKISDYKNKLSLSVGDKQLFRKNGCYIVVGGLTGLGWILMEWIAKMGGGHLRSISRRPPSSSQLHEMQSLMNDTHCCIKAIQGDITELDTLKSVFSELKDELNDIPIKGVFNGAGCLEDCLMINMSENDLDKVILPKILGSLNLHVVTEDLDLDFFVMHSSVVSILGNVGQSSYAAGNSFVDALARFRRSRNLCAQTINWGPLKDIGMMENKSELTAKLESRGFNVVDKEDICVCMEHVLISDDVHIIFGSFNWSLVGANSNQSKLEGVIPWQTITARSMTNASSHEFDRDRYSQLTDKDKSSLLFDLVQHVLCHVFPVTDKSILSPGFTLYELGLDSFTASFFVQTIFSYTRVRIPFEVMLSSNTTIETITSHIKENICSPVPSENNVSKQIVDANPNISFIERSALSDFEGNPEKSKFLEVFDLAIEGRHWDLGRWKTVLQHVVYMNPGLGRHFIKNSQGFDVEHIDEQNLNVDVQLMPFDEMDTNEPRNHITFDLSKELPIKFQIGQDTSRAVLRIILHPVIADLSSELIICRDLKDIRCARMKNEKLPKRKENVDIALILHALANEAGIKAKVFWNTQLRHVTEPVTVGSGGVLATLDRRYFRLIKGSFPVSVTERVFDFLKSENVTLFQLFMSVYQIFLFMIQTTQTNIIPVVAPIDLRIHSKELQNVVGRCVNDTPHVAVLKENQSFRQFLHANAERIILATSHSGYPYQMMIQELPSKTMQENIGRHRLCTDDISDVGYFSKVGNLEVNFENSWTVSDENETYLGVTFNKKARTLLYEFGYNAGIYRPDKGTNAPTGIIALLDYCMENPGENLRMAARRRYDSSAY